MSTLLGIRAVCLACPRPIGVAVDEAIWTFAIEAGGSKYRVRLNRIIRKGADWLKARFEIESKA